jgi:A/G-specific adenine glycosylase
MMVDALVAWFEENRRDLPWRRSYEPYEVWVSEVMLQQTQVETVLPYFERFISTFPTVTSLALAPEEQVLKLWEGLGYYSRAKNLIAAARIVAAEHGGKVPSSYDDLIKLPGVGPYMAGAILSVAFNKPYPIVDGNVRRVLSRINGWTEDDPKAQWTAAKKLAGAAEPRLINQSLMELGAKVCSFRAPRCLLCPVQAYCIAFKAGLQAHIPPVRKRHETVHVRLSAVVQKRGSRYLMKPVKGMWEFPMFSELPPGEWTDAGSCRHTITHHRIDVHVYLGALADRSGCKWKAIAEVPVSSLTRKIFNVAAGSKPSVVDVPEIKRKEG